MRIGGEDIWHHLPHPLGQHPFALVVCPDLGLKAFPTDVRLSLELREAVGKELVEVQTKAITSEMRDCPFVQGYRMFSEVLVKFFSQLDVGGRKRPVSGGMKIEAV